MVTGLTKFNFGNIGKWAKPNEAELAARRKVSASVKRASPKAASPKAHSPKAASPKAASPKAPSPKRPSPLRSAARSNIKARANAAYQEAYRKAINKTRTKTWQNKAANAAKAFKNAGIGANKWVNAVARAYAQHEAISARSRVYGMIPGKYQALPGSLNYIPTNHPLYNSLNKLRRQLTA